MNKKIISTILALTIMTTPCIALARNQHYHQNKNHRHHRRYHHNRHRSMHKGDYIAIAAGVIIGTILANK